MIKTKIVNSYLYHFTSTYHLMMILETGFLKLTPSGLKETKNPRIVNGKLIDDNMDYKPVVWLTDSDQPLGLGLEGSTVDKSEIRITLLKKENYKYWLGWANNNLMNKKWQKEFIASTPQYKTWYVSEQVIPLNDVLKIENLKTGKIILDNCMK